MRFITIFSPPTPTQEIMGRIQENPANRVCADCTSVDPSWGVVNLGIMVCIECSGVHRSMGILVSKVRSLELDRSIWTDSLIRVSVCMMCYSRTPLIGTLMGQKKVGGVLISGVDKYTNMVLGEEESVLFREVSLFQGLKSTQTWYLGKKKVSCLERCPYFRSVLIEGFHCNTVYLNCETECNFYSA